MPDNKILVGAYGDTELPDQKENRKTNGEKTYPHGPELEDRQTEDVNEQTNLRCSFCLGKDEHHICQFYKTSNLTVLINISKKQPNKEK